MSPRWIRGKWVIACASLVIDQEEVIPRSEDVIEPKVETQEVIRVVVLDRSAGEPAVGEIVADSRINNMVSERGAGGGENALAIGVRRLARSCQKPTPSSPRALSMAFAQA